MQKRKLNAESLTVESFEAGPPALWIDVEGAAPATQQVRCTYFCTYACPTGMAC